jgi:hypothetical protein
VVLIDGTFKTNNLNLVLVAVNGITNTGKTFPVCFSFVRSEAKISIDFIFMCLKDLVFGIAVGATESLRAGIIYGKPKVAISDQAPGIISSVETSLPDTTLQFCDWHAVENIRKRTLEKKYTKEERDLIRAAIWDWIKAKTKMESSTARADLFSLLRQSEIDYIKTWWVPREKQLLRMYTSKYANLGCNSNQRSEGSNVKIKVILNHQLSLEETCRRLASTVSTDLRALDRLESEEGGDLPRTLDKHAFKRVGETVTRWAIDKVSPEWEATKVAVDSGDLSYSQFSDDCRTCELPLRFGLPCRHTLCLAYLRGDLLPKSVFHPRWWIYGPAIKEDRWHPMYESTELPISPPRRGTAENTLISGQLQVLNERETLPLGARAEYDEMITTYHRTMVNTAEFLRQRETQTVTQMIPRNEKKKWLTEKKVHGKANARALTGAEMAEKALDKVEKAAKKAERAQQQAQEQLETQDEIVVAPRVQVIRTSTPPPATAPPERAPSPPPSTAVPAMTEERSKRPRAQTGYFAALNSGDSQKARQKRARR